mmetsp:Transcript_28286/g.53176  ORF Transcript_28286/g.53176 Transcript_28286/m.53176 type:complete len:107 (+) Transcript_28286:683-1003(+)
MEPVSASDVDESKAKRTTARRRVGDLFMLRKEFLVLLRLEKQRHLEEVYCKYATRSVSLIKKIEILCSRCFGGEQCEDGGKGTRNKACTVTATCHLSVDVRYIFII